MRHPFIQFMLLVAVLAVETTMLRDVGISGVRPDFYLVCFIFLSMSQGVVSGTLLGFSLGLVLDFISIAPLGLSAFTLSLIGFGLASLRGKLFLDPIFMPILLTILVSLAHWLVSSFLISIFGIEPSSTIPSSLLLRLAMNAFLAPIVFGIFRLTGAVPQYLREEER